MGRPRKPVEAKQLAGNPGKRNLPAPVETVAGIATVPKAPTGLQAPGKRFWADAWVAGHTWLHPQLDAATVELAARTFDEVAKYRESLAKDGLLLEEPIVSPSGKVVGTRLVPNPAEAMLRRAERQLERWLVVLAIPPTARAALGLVQVKAQSTLEELLSRRSTRSEDVIDADGWDADDD